MHQRRRIEKQTPFTKLKQFNAYAKTLDDFRVKTSTGAAGKIRARSMKAEYDPQGGKNGPMTLNSGSTPRTDPLCMATTRILLVSIACGIIIVILFLGEYFDYRSILVESSLVVDTGRKERMDIELDISFPKIPCYGKLCNFLGKETTRKRKPERFLGCFV